MQNLEFSDAQAGSLLLQSALSTAIRARNFQYHFPPISHIFIQHLLKEPGTHCGLETVPGAESTHTRAEAGCYDWDPPREPGSKGTVTGRRGTEAPGHHGTVTCPGSGRLLTGAGAQ